MPDYSKGKIYKLVDLTNNKLYVGSTTQRLSKRLSEHVYQYKKGTNYYSSFSIIENMNYRIELIEEYPCDNKEQLFAREGHWIRETDCVNKCVVGRTRNQYRKDNCEKIQIQTKQYRDRNKNKIKELQKKWREDNKEKRKMTAKKYNEENKEHLKQYQKKYRDQNKERLKEYYKQYYLKNKDKIS